jgi:hypothetical protein
MSQKKGREDGSDMTYHLGHVHFTRLPIAGQCLATAKRMLRLDKLTAIVIPRDVATGNVLACVFARGMTQRAQGIEVSAAAASWIP